MLKLYSKINFLNRPSKKTPLNAANLNKMDEAIDGLDDRVVSTNDALLVERTRIDNLTKLPEGSTTADAALYDINIGYDGTDWKTPGNAVRGQISQLSSEIENVESELKQTLVDLNGKQNDVLENETIPFTNVIAKTYNNDNVYVKYDGGAFTGFAMAMKPLNKSFDTVIIKTITGADCTLSCEIHSGGSLGSDDFLVARKTIEVVGNTETLLEVKFDELIDTSSFEYWYFVLKVVDDITGLGRYELANNVGDNVFSNSSHYNKYKTKSGWANLNNEKQYLFMLLVDVGYDDFKYNSARLENIENDIYKAEKTIEDNLVKMNYLYVSKEYTKDDADYLKTKFNDIFTANNYIRDVFKDNSYYNRYTIIVKNGTYTDLQEKYSGIRGSWYQGITCTDYVYYESEDIMHPENCIIEWNGATGFTSPTQADVINKCPFHVIGQNNGLHTHIKGFTFNCKNMRYAIHTETEGKGVNTDWEISNCVFNWGNNADVSGYSDAPVIGMGSSAFEVGRIKDCVLNNTLDGSTQGIQNHTDVWSANYGYTPFLMKGANITVENCKMNGLDINFRTMHDIYETPNVLNIKGCAGINRLYHNFLNGMTKQAWLADVSASEIVSNEME